MVISMSTMKSIYRTVFFSVLIGSLLVFSGCGSKSPSLVVSRVTHFLVQGNGESLNFPLFAETIGIETIERDLAIAEYYHKKLSELYSFKSFNLINSAVSEYLLSSAAEFNSLHPIYQYEDSLTSIELSLVRFEAPQADYSFRITDRLNHQTRHHQVSVQNNQSASVGLLFDEAHNRGHLIVIQLYSLAITPDVTPAEFAEFLKHKNSVHDSALEGEYVRGDQKWMDELFKGKSIPLPMPPPVPSLPNKSGLIDYDTPPSPVSGYLALQKAVQYPSTAKAEGRTGRVLLKVFIDEHGDVTEHEILKSAFADLDSAAIAATKSIKFNPAMKNDKPIGVWVTIPLDFKLK